MAMATRVEPSPAVGAPPHTMRQAHRQGKRRVRIICRCEYLSPPALRRKVHEDPHAFEEQEARQLSRARYLDILIRDRYRLIFISTRDSSAFAP